MKHVLFWLALVILVLVAVRALADREGRAKAVFDARCAHCHVVGWGAPLAKRPGIVDLTLSAKNHDLKWLREWIADPMAKKSETLCRSAGLDRVQIDLLIGFLDNHAKTLDRKLVVPRPQPKIQAQP